MVGMVVGVDGAWRGELGLGLTSPLALTLAHPTTQMVAQMLLGDAKKVCQQLREKVYEQFGIV